MKNRNDDRKYIFAKEKEYDVQRLYKKIDQINNRKTNKSSQTFRSFYKQVHQNTRKNIQDIKNFSIKKENQRLIQRLCLTRTTVCPHIIKHRVLNRRKVFMMDLLKERKIQKQNHRLAKVITSLNNSKHSSKKLFQKVL